MSSGNQVLLGQYGATNRTYSSSSLILHRGTYICTGPGVSCVPVHPCRALTRIGSRTIGNARFLEMQTGLPEQLQTHSKSAGPPGDGVFLSPGSAARECTEKPVNQPRRIGMRWRTFSAARGKHSRHCWVWLGQRYHTQSVQHSRVVIPGERESPPMQRSTSGRQGEHRRKQVEHLTLQRCQPDPTAPPLLEAWGTPLGEALTVILKSPLTLKWPHPEMHGW